MSLTVLINEKLASVTMVQWFLGNAAGVEYACGPLIRMSTQQFRRSGRRAILAHFKEYEHFRLCTGEQGQQVLETRREKQGLKAAHAVRIDEYPRGTLIFSPLEVRKCSLSGLAPLPSGTEQRVSRRAPSKAFWDAFDRAVAHTFEPDE
jgi:hypothetical protein